MTNSASITPPQGGAVITTGRRVWSVCTLNSQGEWTAIRGADFPSSWAANEYAQMVRFDGLKTKVITRFKHDT
jgi:hypothetical protein